MSDTTQVHDAQELKKATEDGARVIEVVGEISGSTVSASTRCRAASPCGTASPTPRCA